MCTHSFSFLETLFSWTTPFTTSAWRGPDLHRPPQNCCDIEMVFKIGAMTSSWAPANHLHFFEVFYLSPIISRVPRREGPATHQHAHCPDERPPTTSACFDTLRWPTFIFGHSFWNQPLDLIVIGCTPQTATPKPTICTPSSSRLIALRNMDYSQIKRKQTKQGLGLLSLAFRNLIKIDFFFPFRAEFDTSCELLSTVSTCKLSAWLRGIPTYQAGLDFGPTLSASARFLASSTMQRRWAT